MPLNGTETVLSVGFFASPSYDRSGTLIAADDDWKINSQTGQSQESAIKATGVAPSNDRESALLQIVGPGNYTAIVRGKNNGTGVGLLEVYNIH